MQYHVNRGKDQYGQQRGRRQTEQQGNRHPLENGVGKNEGRSDHSGQRRQQNWFDPDGTGPKDEFTKVRRAPRARGVSLVGTDEVYQED